MILKSLSTKSMNAKILILGKGYIGEHLKIHLENSGYDVSIWSSDIVDYHNPKTFWMGLVSEEPNLIINCSGFTGNPNVDEAETLKELCWKLNVTSPLNCVRFANKKGIKYIHISSGCIYDGYEKEFTETDTPNFGLFDQNSSFYSKSKHAFELLSQEFNLQVIRLRMPLSPVGDKRSLLTKLLNYDNLINYKNSKTSISDLCNFIISFINDETVSWDGQNIYNVVHPNPLSTKEVIDIMKEFGVENKNWKFVNIEDLNLATSRSNCVLSTDKISRIYNMPNERDALIELLQ